MEQPVRPTCPKLPISSASKEVVMMFRVEDRTYNPEQIAVMVSAFETAYGSLSMGTNVNIDDVRETLARIVLWHFDLGERDPVRLSKLSVRTLVDGLPPDESVIAGEGHSIWT
jgi:hypothetical protein